MQGDEFELTGAVRDILIPEILPFMLGSLIVFIGFSSLLVWLIRKKAGEIYFLYMGVFTLLFGLRMLAGNELTILSGAISPALLLWTESVINYYLTVFSILFVTRFIGWGWKKTLLWFLLLQAGYAITATIIDLYVQIPYYSGVPCNNFFAITGTLLVLANLFQTHVRLNHEIKVLGLGFGIFALSILAGNLAEIHVLPEIFFQEQPAFFICLCLLIYVAVRRSTISENNLMMVKRDLETARNIQKAILPQVIPSPGGLRISARYIPMTQVGGDFYDFHQTDDQHLGILIADVSGHGMPAALVASMVKIAFISQLSNASRPEALLRGMNNILTGQTNNEFITAMYLYVDLESMNVTLSMAGHPPPLILFRAQASAEPIQPGGIPLGIRKGVGFPCRKIKMTAGDRFLIYTDGLTETASCRGELFGTARLSLILEELRELPPEQAADGILSTVHAWAGRKKERSPEDDLTFILFDAG